MVLQGNTGRVNQTKKLAGMINTDVNQIFLKSGRIL